MRLQNLRLKNLHLKNFRLKDLRLKNLRLKLNRTRLSRFLFGKGRKSRKPENGRKKRDHPSWTMHVSHGYHVVESDKPWTTNSVVVQREHIQECELRFFGVFDHGIGEAVTNHMQSHFFDNMPQQSRMGGKCIEAMERAHHSARTMLIDRNEEAVAIPGSASAVVIDNEEKLVIANMGGYGAVICRDGEAYQICRKNQQPFIRNWSLKFLSGVLRVPKSCSGELVVGSERINSETEFVILASSGVWEVMKHQEAVNLIRHIQDPQAAAACLAKEALVRMSRSSISCLIIRFD